MPGERCRGSAAVPAVGILIACCSLGATDTSQAQPPDIVVILADDLGYSDIGSYGSEIETPNLDRLAHDGLRFTALYNFSRCMPTRAALLTGHYPHSAGLGGAIRYEDRPNDPSGVFAHFLGPEPGPYQGYLHDTLPTLAELLGRAGYRTYMSGKWHVGERRDRWPHARGFDRFFGLIGGESSYFEPVAGQGEAVRMVRDDQPWSPPAHGYYATDAYTDAAVEFIAGHHRRHAGRPLFLYLAYTAPHFPLHAREEDIERFAGRYDEGWDIVRERRIERQRALGIVGGQMRPAARPESVPAWASVDYPSHWSRRMEVYAAMIHSMDRGIGRVLGALEATGRRDDTLILFFSDNGPSSRDLSNRPAYDPSATIGARGSYYNIREPWAWVSAAPFRGYKAESLEGGIRSPLVVNWPAGVADAGRVEPAPLAVIDLLPTLLGIVGSDYPQSFAGVPTKALPGVDFRGLLDGSATVEARSFYFEHYEHRALNDGAWKVAYSPVEKRWSLYRLADDPAETRDLAAMQPQRLAAMVSEWTAWADTVGVRRHE